MRDCSTGLFVSAEEPTSPTLPDSWEIVMFESLVSPSCFSFTAVSAAARIISVSRPASSGTPNSTVPSFLTSSSLLSSTPAPLSTSIFRSLLSSLLDTPLSSPASLFTSRDPILSTPPSLPHVLSPVSPSISPWLFGAFKSLSPSRDFKVSTSLLSLSTAGFGFSSTPSTTSPPSFNNFSSFCSLCSGFGESRLSLFSGRTCSLSSASRLLERELAALRFPAKRRTFIKGEDFSFTKEGWIDNLTIDPELPAWNRTKIFPPDAARPDIEDRRVSTPMMFPSSGSRTNSVLLWKVKMNRSKIHEWR